MIVLALLDEIGGGKKRRQLLSLRGCAFFSISDNEVAVIVKGTRDVNFLVGQIHLIAGSFTNTSSN